MSESNLFGHTKKNQDTLGYTSSERYNRWLFAS